MSELDANIQEHYNRVFKHNPDWELINPCLINNGIIKINKDVKSECIELFFGYKKEINFFIPASGSGSRMFSFLREMESGVFNKNDENVVLFLNSIEKFAFWDLLPDSIKNDLKYQNNYISFLQFLFSENGLNFKNIPKGLIPFHRYPGKILNPFQEQVLQANFIGDNKKTLHFTIQDRFKDEISRSINSILNTGVEAKIEYSIQSSDSDVQAFCSKGQPVYDQYGQLLKMPAGHGALLNNLNEFKEEIILIKNIDNAVHQDQIADSVSMWRELIGLMLLIKSEAQKIWENPTIEMFYEFNKKFQLLHTEELSLIRDASQIKEFLHRPFRICGMVKNQGEPGGGPFWVKKDGKISKQIVEKSQIPDIKSNQDIIALSTHFNPVIMVISSISLDGVKYNLNEFADHSNYLVVEKNYGGQVVKFAELPGLWNGGMANWNSIFVEVPDTVFSPVKSILDLLRPDHTRN
jgi:hypothetical protein